MNFTAKFEEIRTEVLDRGGSRADMAQQACEWLKREGLIVECFEEFGAYWLAGHFQDIDAHARHKAGRWENPGKQKVSAKVLNNQEAIFDISFPVGGKPKRLGDLIAHDCQELREFYTAMGDANLRRAEFFKRLKIRLTTSKAKTIREAFKNRAASLIRLYKKVESGDE